MKGKLETNQGSFNETEVEDLKTKMSDLSSTLMKIGEKVYAQNPQEPSGDANKSSTSPKDENVVDV